MAVVGIGGAIRAGQEVAASVGMGAGGGGRGWGLRRACCCCGSGGGSGSACPESHEQAGSWGCVVRAC
eukprot:212839-Pelagomonas_calceolata.AAC.1